jgi:hypothetical protein
MPKKIERVSLRIIESKNGWQFQYCKDNWITMPFIWPSEASARHDFMIVLESLIKNGYEVLTPTQGEVKTV